MKPEDKITRNYDIELISGDVIRAEEQLRVISRLDQLFTPEHTAPVTVKGGLEELPKRLEGLVGGCMLSARSSSLISAPYESFSNGGVTLDSRIVQIDCKGLSSSFVNSKIYLIALMGAEQTHVTTLNCTFGAIKTEAGHLEFFKVQPNPSIGQLVVSRAIQDPENQRRLAEEGTVSTNKIVVSALSPEESYLAVGEFQKALDAYRQQ